MFRKGATLAAYASADGENWAYLRHTTTTLPAAYLAGLAATSGDTTEENSSAFDHVSILSGANFPPQTTLSGPLPGRSYNTGVPILLSATASDLDGAATIVSVAF